MESREPYNMVPQEFFINERVETENDITYHLEPLLSPDKCLQCGSYDFIRWGRKERKARDLNEGDKTVCLIINAFRYRCKNCNTTFVSDYLSIDSRAKMTNRMKTYIQKKSLQTPFLHIQKELSVSVPTIRKLFNDYVAESDAKRVLFAPRVLGIEGYIFNNHYRSICLDANNGLILDILPDREPFTFKNWVESLIERDHLECVSIDMYKPYKEVLNSILPGIPIYIDKYGGADKNLDFHRAPKGAFYVFKTAEN